MWGRLSAAVSVLAVVCGFAAAPYTHAHHAIDSVGDERHPHGDTLVHAHASPHAHQDADHPDPEPAREDEHDQIWSVNSSVSGRPAPGHAPSVLLVTCGEPQVHLPRLWVDADRLQPKAHGPPVGSPASLRAPPAILPALA